MVFSLKELFLWEEEEEEGGDSPLRGLSVCSVYCKTLKDFRHFHQHYIALSHPCPSVFNVLLSSQTRIHIRKTRTYETPRVPGGTFVCL